jgi:uncharacterized repeat protein (TIGR01451 family)
MGILLLSSEAMAQAVPASCPSSLATANIIDHDFSVSFCELCDVGTVRIEIENPYRNNDDADFSDLVVTENLLASGLTYVAGSTDFDTDNVAPPPVVEPVVSGPNGSVLTWTISDQFVLPTRPNFGGGNQRRLTIEFDVRRHAALGEEGLVPANRNIEAEVEFTPSCDTGYRHTSTSGIGELPLREPEPQVIKTGRVVDAGQGPGSYTSTIYGHENDDAIWRIEVRNNGQADLQDFIFSDTMQPGNFEIDWICDSEGEANSAASGGGTGDCVNVGGVTDLSGVAVEPLFDAGPGPYIVAPAGGSGFYYLVGRITDSCTNRTNTVHDVEWGCEVEPPPGGIPATSNGQTAQDDALLSTLSLENGLDLDVFMTGTNTSQPMGTKGRIRIRIRNQTGGTIKGGIDGLKLRHVLPPEYVVDPTFDPYVQVSPAYGNNYPGMLDTVEWTNPQPNTYPLTTIDPALPLGNTAPEFLVTSSTVHPDFADQFNMLRHGDTLNVYFRVVLIDPQYYDLEAYVDVREEEPASDPPDTDPTEDFPISSQTEVWWEEFCTNTEHYLLVNDNDDAEPEDLDVDVSGNVLNFILTNTDVLPLRVQLRNRGGHDADDYFTYVTFGEAMTVQTAPNSCSATSNPPPMPVWTDPVGPPGSATIYACDVGVIPAGATRNLDFQVVKNTDPSADDDLTFRADVIGEITLSDGTPLWFPTPQPRGDGITDRANNYSIDAVRARVVGYNLTKDQLGTCSENNPPPASPDIEIQIGEECDFHIESGGWFGFMTPGYTYIAVQDVQVVDQIPDGQGYISSTDPLGPGYSTTEIEGVSLNPPPVPLDEAPFDWTHNTNDPAERIDVKDHWFRVDVTTRLLNDPVDQSAAPNQHAAQSTNLMTSTFDAVFLNALTNEEEIYTLGTSTVGYPPEFRRRVDLTVTEPNLIVEKEVCNETIYGVGPACTNFVPLADDGDAYDTYIFRITVTNEAAAGGVTRAPAYDVTVTSDTDPTDLIFVDPLDADGLDNDGDGEIDEAGGEGQIVPDNTILNGSPAQIIAAYTHSDALLRIDAGDSVVMYYRVDPYDDVAPLQQLTNSAYATYDSLEADSGNQTAPQGANGEIGGARQYVSATAEAIIQIIPVEVQPKQIIRLSNTPLVAPVTPQPVSIGEEIEFELRTLIPVAQLRSFVIRDELPAGMRCTEAPVVDLDAPPYDAAGFMPGGTFTPTCSDTEVIWDFGNQTVTMSPRVDRRFDFGIQFIARIDNVDQNRDGYVIGNGGTYTVTNVTYIDEAGNPVVIDFEAAEVVVSEPLVELTKEFAVETADADDILTVTVTATNNGTATAYNLRVLDDLTGTDFSYVGNLGGTTPPVNVDTTTYGPDSPIFNWDPGFAIAVGESIDFSFDVQVGDTVQPLQVLENTVQGDWTSLPGQDTALNTGGTIGVDGDVDGMRNGALPNAGDVINDYEAEASDSVYVPSLAIAKSDLDTALPPEIGAHKSFEVQVDLPEGVSNGVSMNDDLAFGSVSYVLADNADFDVTYEFVGIASINGQTPAEAALNAVPADGASGVAVWDIGSVVTDTEDDTATQDVNPYIRISYFARINNDLATNVGSTLQNSATAYFVNGETGGQEAVNDTTAAIVATEPELTATKAISNVTPGKNAGDPIALGDIVQYVLTIPNMGNAIAYDTNITDTLPPELSLYGAYTPTAQIDGIDVAGFNGIPAGAPGGPLVWGAGNGDGSLDVPIGSTLEVTYQVQLVAPADESIALTNIVYVDWTSLDDASVYERTGDGCPTITPPDDYCYGPASADGQPYPVGPPGPLTKANTQATATIGEVFNYRITIPATPYPLPLYDVRISDDLGASAADLSYVSVTKVSGSGPWTPVNSGTATDLVIEDTTTGIDIPIGEQIILDVSVRLDDTPTNVAGLTFTNTATWSYNRLDSAPATVLPGEPWTTQPMTVVEPDLTLEKSGPTQMQLGVPETFTLDIHNAGMSPAWNVTIYDLLPNQADGGMCDAAPAQFTAQVFEADGTTAVSPVLAEGTDYSVVFAGDPDCTLTISLLNSVGAIGADQRLIVTYQTSLDLDSQQGATLTNVAGATEWFSLDVSDSAMLNYARTYTRTVTDGTVNTLDHEDAYTVVVFTPVLIFEKTVVNATTGEDPGTVATPGDRLRYSLRIENASDTPLNGFRIVDELDRLNAAAAFQPGSLSLITVPAGANTINTDPAGGAAGTGLLDISDLNLGGLGESVLVVFEVDLAPAIANGTFVYNQSEIRFAGLPVALSDDPYVNGAADPNVTGDEDPTQIQIISAPAFRIEKISSYITGDPNVLLAGETLRYTITVQNVGTDNAVGVEIADQVPGNTTYVAGSTALNGVAVPDSASGSPLVDGILINAPGDPTPGVMNAAAPDNVATIIFDVVVYPDVADGTVISNQAFLSAVDYGIADAPSDDPRTAVPDDPTRDVVGNYPLLFAPKTAALQVDGASPGIVDPGDIVRYTITIYNNGAVPATVVDLYDSVPPDMTYVADSTTLNGLPVGQPDGGAFPLFSRIPVSSADLTPPIPGLLEGVLNPGQSAVVQFDMQVNAGVPSGTLITNQATVYTAELPNLLTDGDGNPATGPEPTVVVVGDAQQLAIIKEVSVVNGGPALAGATLEYLVTVRNIGAVPALYVVITDDLDAVNPGYITYVDPSATLNGLSNGVSFAGTTITADYGTEYGPLNPGEAAVLRFRAIIDPNLANGTTITNTGRVSWNDPLQWAEASVSIDVGAMPGAGMLSGNVWHDADHDDTPDGVERPLQGWTVELLRDGQPIRSMLTDVDGNYLITNVTPNYVSGEIYSLRFSAPGAGSRTALLGQTDSDFTNGLQRIDDIVVTPGSNLLSLNMPVDPNGVIYDSVARTPVAGATATLVDVRNGAPLPGDCFDDPNQQDQVTVANGYYKFDINFSDPACPSGINYLIRITVPNSSYVSGVSELIPPTSDPTTLPFDVPACPGSANDAVLATPQYCEAQLSEFAPPSSVPARSAGTNYHSFLRLDDSQLPGTGQLFNNHIPIDPRLGGAVAITKSTPLLNVTRGQMVPYVITASNSFGADLTDVSIVDRFPAGFHYVEGSARFDDVPTEPAIVGRELIWSNLLLAVDGRHEIKLLLAVGAGVTEGEFVNRAQAVSSVTGIVMSEEASATVRLVPDPTFDCTDVTGKVFDDANRNGYQDGDESGLAGVRVVTARGLAATTDANGRYHFTCAITPNESRGSNFVLKLDDRTLPSGFRVSTRPVQVQRATRGKALRINFGASIHRVVGLDIADAVFEPDSVEMRHQWRPRIVLLLDELQRGPAVLRLSYVADVESEALVERRVDAIKNQIMTAWEDLNCCYELVIEPEIFWRLGAPPDKRKGADR